VLLTCAKSLTKLERFFTGSLRNGGLKELASTRAASSSGRLSTKHCVSDWETISLETKAYTTLSVAPTRVMTRIKHVRTYVYILSRTFCMRMHACAPILRIYVVRIYVRIKRTYNRIRTININYNL
jgi:hypothetical protein